MINFLTFNAFDNSVDVKQMVAYESRGEAILAILRRLVQQLSANFKFEGTIYFDDNPPKNVNIEGEIVFCTTQEEQSDMFLPFPAFVAHSWPEIGVFDSQALFEQILKNDAPPDSPNIFWIGADTNPIRKRLVVLSSIYDFVEASFMNWEKTPSPPYQSSNFVSINDHVRYKYLIDVPGYGYSGRLQWLLATGRPVFIVDRPVKEFWHNKMVPWLHYVPVRSDLSDLKTQYNKMQGDPKLYDFVSKNAKQFSRNNLRLDEQIDHSVERLRFHINNRTRMKRQSL